MKTHNPKDYNVSLFDQVNIIENDLIQFIKQTMEKNNAPIRLVAFSTLSAAVKLMARSGLSLDQFESDLLKSMPLLKSIFENEIEVHKGKEC